MKLSPEGFQEQSSGWRRYCDSAFCLLGETDFKKQHVLVQMKLLNVSIVRRFYIVFLFLFVFPYFFCPLSLSYLWEYRKAHLSTHTHQGHSQWTSVLNSKLKTHYQAISALIMLSNNLISLSVSPGSHLRACQLLSEGAGRSRGTPPPPPRVLIRNRIESSISENMSRKK